METIKERVLKILDWEDIHPHVSRSRVPFTYHHDYLRTNYSQFNGKSCGEIAQLTRNSSEDLLYAGCLLGVCLNLTTADLMFLNESELKEFAKLFKVCHILLNNYYKT